MGEANPGFASEEDEEEEEEEARAGSPRGQEPKTTRNQRLASHMLQEPDNSAGQGPDQDADTETSKTVESKGFKARSKKPASKQREKFKRTSKEKKDAKSGRHGNGEVSHDADAAEVVVEEKETVLKAKKKRKKKKEKEEKDSEEEAEDDFPRVKR